MRRRERFDCRRRLPSALAALCCAAAAPAGQPLLLPMDDVAVTYSMAQPGGAPPAVQRTHWSARTRQMRIDPPSPGLYVVIDYAAHQMRIVREPSRSVVEMAAPAGPPGLETGAAGAGYRQTGRAEIAGATCTEWAAPGARPDAGPGAGPDAGAAAETRICVTDRGVLLRVVRGGATLAVATAVQLAPQAPALFTVPADYARVAPPR